MRPHRHANAHREPAVKIGFIHVQRYGVQIGPLWCKLIWEPRDLWFGAYIKKPWVEMGHHHHAVYLGGPVLLLYVEWRNFIPEAWT